MEIIERNAIETAPAPGTTLAKGESAISEAATSDNTNGSSPTSAGPRLWQIGVSLPPLEVEDLPTPEEVFKVRRIGLEELVLLVLGPGVIGLGISIGSGEWLLAPLAIGQFGFQGVFWVGLVSIVLQVFYNVELARYTLATGEPPIVGFGRTPPGHWIWVPLALLLLYIAFLMGGWTVEAGASLLYLVTGQPPGQADLGLARLIGIGLLISMFFLLTLGRKIERTLEFIQFAFLPYILLGLLMVTLVVVPLDYLWSSLAAFFIPAAPPQGVDFALLGAIAGFAALASGLNFMFIGYYRDKGYGMGSRTGYLSGLVGGKAGTLSPVSKTFPEDARNAAVWKRWFRYLLIDQWGIYFIGIVMGMTLPSILYGYLLSTSGSAPADATSIVGALAGLLGQKYGQLLTGWVLVLGFVILYSTQIGVLELLARNLTDVLYSLSKAFRASVGDDVRRFYYPTLLVLVLVISVVIHLGPPVQMNILSANLANLAAMIFPLVMIYLNRRLPRPARSSTWSIILLVANVLFFGLFFINFILVELTGTVLVRF
jgi:hypothetical protein